MKCEEFLLPAWVAARVSLMIDNKEREVIRMKLGIEFEGRKRNEDIRFPSNHALDAIDICSLRFIDYSEAKFSSQDDAPILVEWFHGEDETNLRN